MANDFTLESLADMPNPSHLYPVKMEETILVRKRSNPQRIASIHPDQFDPELHLRMEDVEVDVKIKAASDEDKGGRARVRRTRPVQSDEDED